MMRLRANGLRPITQPVQTGRYIVVRAVDPYGSVVRVLFDARYGNIVSIVPLPPAPIVGESYGRPYGPYASRRALSRAMARRRPISRSSRRRLRMR